MSESRRRKVHGPEEGRGSGADGGPDEGRVIENDETPSIDPPAGDDPGEGDALEPLPSQVVYDL